MSAVDCGSTVLANTDPSIFMLGTRERAVPLRQQVEHALDQSDLTVCIDFRGTSVTQGFMDELLGVLILRRGPSILERLAFKQCTEDVQAVVRFVAACRVRDYNEGELQPAHA